MLSTKEGEILLVLFKDFSTWHNATTMSKVVGITPRGALKALSNLEKEEFVTSKIFGKAKLYRVDFNNLTKKTLELLLLEEAERKYARWTFEFKNFDEAKILGLFGSVLRKKDPNDIDLLIVIEKGDYKNIEDKITQKNKILLHPIHPIFQTIEDLKKNIKKKDEVVLEILRTGIFLKGQKEIVEVVQDVTSTQSY